MKPVSLRPFLPRPAIRRRIWMSRSYAVQAPGSPTLQIFNRHTKYLQKERAASDVERSRQVDYLKDEVAMRLSERLLDINREFDNVLDLGANSCQIARALTLPERYPDPTKEPVSISSRLSKLTAAESSRSMLYRDVDLPFNQKITLTREVLDDEERLPFEANTFDAVLSSLSMHWINDLPSLLAQINHVLKPDSPFLAAMFGGDTLYELRTSLQLADQERRGGVSPHVSPLADVRDMGGLLQKAGFKMLTVDVDDIIVDFPDTFSLMQDLQAMGESNAILGREPGAIKRDVLLANEGIYRELHGNEDGTLPATFRMIYMIGWKEGPNQSQPLPRGSGEINLKDILGGGDIR
ncbi:methyltransferase domain-containing protein [Drepanopeziza brunnea f. sp. 'multigermtubi' MB_m1]|uniref:Methyltransferase domain-containing protein n=1 Tax=Marssonina brunnea f. sp. multigermtubi (strain MB_m1) TaxID=1072389 RepID=K1WYT8_MARBU|nr:methyltransferase domain-containing protein [Drepanopeziza brunnea f. sp. 'multigermtubi' MB_m1]EKD17767.1 methyltransferase domain-containing protein [Drepanopeziza brunnea f. sp. 'multigermtubi' MB_m1]